MFVIFVKMIALNVNFRIYKCNMIINCSAADYDVRDANVKNIVKASLILSRFSVPASIRCGHWQAPQ